MMDDAMRGYACGVLDEMQNPPIPDMSEVAVAIGLDLWGTHIPVRVAVNLVVA